jgi:hypothetical protein
VNEVAELDIPCDVQGRDRDAHLWAFLDEAAHPEVVVVGNLVVTGDAEAPVVARVLYIVDRPAAARCSWPSSGAPTNSPKPCPGLV